MAIVRGISIDLDGCYMNHAYISLLKNNFDPRSNIIAANIELLDSINESKQHYKSTHVFIGSNRQSIGDDKINAYSTQNGSGFPRALYIANYLAAPLDKLLLTDVYNDLPDGETFEQALFFLDNQNHDYKQEDCKGITFLDWLHDESKMTILYAQIHKLASENLGDEIEFNFYDDREDILDNLQQFFLNHLELLPDNVTLNLIKYAGPTNNDGNKIEAPTIAYPPIRGQGTIDTQYRNTVKKIAAECFQSPNFQARFPANQRGQIVRNYEEAKEANFVVTEPLNCARDYKTVQTPPATVNWVQAKYLRSSTIIIKSGSIPQSKAVSGLPQSTSSITPPVPSNIPRASSSSFWTTPSPLTPQKVTALFQFGQHRTDEAEETEETEEEKKLIPPLSPRQ